jgi:zinc protease
MPNQYDYSLQFFNRYYRPEYTTILLVGDITRDRALALTKQYFGDWQRGGYISKVPAEPPQTSPREEKVEWPAPTLPWVAVAFRAPAYSDQDKDKAALNLLAPIAFGPNSEVYQRLVLKEQKADALFVGVDDAVDPEMFAVYVRVKDPKDIPYVREQILATFRNFTDEAVSQSLLDATRSRIRYEFSLSMDSSNAIANAIAPYIGLRRTPETINKLFTLYQQITPDDIRAAAGRYFNENSRTIVTLEVKK